MELLVSTKPRINTLINVRIGTLVPDVVYLIY